MIDLAKYEIIQGTRRAAITGFSCWWAVPGKGLYPQIGDALDAGDTILPAPVALAENDMYELLPPELQR